MPSPELLAPERAERLLAGAPPETSREAAVEGLLRELRATSGPASPELRERVRSLGTAPPRRSRRRTALVLVPAVLALAATVGGIAAWQSGGDERTAVAQSAGDRRAEPGGASAVPSAGSGPTAPQSDDGAEWRAREKDGAGMVLADGAADDAAAEAAVPLPSGRAHDTDLLIALRVRDAERLSEAATTAMTTARDLGGFVRSSQVDTGGREGTARIELRIPTARLEDAILRLSALGEITGQTVATRDLQGGIDRRAARIESLRDAIAADELRLASGTLSPAERLTVELRLVRERAQLRRLARERGALLREAAYAELTLRLHTREAAGAPAKEGGIGGAARDAVDALGRGGEIAVFAGIVAAPFVLLAALLWLALRTRRRRMDERLLERPGPAAPSGP
jgi:hypothetical protein